MNPEPSPCPFCANHNVKLCHDASGDHVFVRCQTCRARGPEVPAGNNLASATEQAITLWNNHTASPHWQVANDLITSAFASDLAQHARIASTHPKLVANTRDAFDRVKAVMSAVGLWDSIVQKMRQYYPAEAEKYL